MVDMLVFRAKPDTLWLRLFGGERAARTLTTFVTDVVDLVASLDDRDGCIGQTLIAESVFEFLFDPVHLQASEAS
ncbi:hypothetical protein PHPALM_27409 [Phytophthora palmivora]|uniref:Uncharacterized protein n=1 Tax=Phytophthora palmivora TaxID=4796 RepID=A0A2P4XCL3_9STRA|nr:hypothetical protein PHPALM_27409 [Phytophthora palmivora]